MKELVKMIYKNKPRSEMIEKVLSYGYSESTVANILFEAQHMAAQQFSDEDVVQAKNQIKLLTEEIMWDDDEFAIAKIKAAELLGKLMKVFNPDIAIQNNTTNNLNLSELTPEQLKSLLDKNDGE
jgi:hypothetical protein